ncbi:MAG: DUF5684 domain-containing protein [Bacteroidota bacterium]
MYEYGNTDPGVFAALGVGYLVFMLLIGAFFIACYWKIFTKAGQPGWAAIVPFYNLYVMLQIVGRPGWWIILMLIPCVNIVVMILLYLDLARVFGKSTGFAIGLILLSVIFIPILAFGDAEYVG